MPKAIETNTTPPLDRYAKAAATRRANKAKRIMNAFIARARMWEDYHRPAEPGSALYILTSINILLDARNYRAGFRVVETPPIPPEGRAIETLLSIDREIDARERRAGFRVIDARELHGGAFS